MKKEDYLKEYFKLIGHCVEAKCGLKMFKKCDNYSIEKLLDLHKEYLIAEKELRKFREKYMPSVVIKK